jgi:hypothetical protein
MHLGHQRAGGIENVQAACLGLGTHRLRDAVGAENDGGAGGHFGEFLDEDRAFCLEVVDDEGVVDDFVADVDRRAELFQRAFDDGDGAVDAGAEAAGIGEKDG